MSKLRLFRTLVAIFSFIVITILFLGIGPLLDTFFDEVILHLQFVPSLLTFIRGVSYLSVGFILFIVLALLFGRIYCSFICPLGIFQDLLIRLEKRIKPKKLKSFTYSNPTPWLKHLVLAATIIALVFGSTALLLLLDPYSNFGRIATHMVQPVYQALNNVVSYFGNMAGYYSIYHIGLKAFHLAAFGYSIFIVGLLILMTFYRGRLFCNTLCPVGTLLGWTSKLSWLKIGFDEQKCIGCKKCERACKAGCIDVKNMKVDFNRCVTCYNCIDVCNDSAIGYKVKPAKKLVEQPVDNSRRNMFKTLVVGTVGLTFLSSKKRDEMTSNFTSKQPAKSKLPVTPPGSVGLNHFKSTCTACHLCVSACPTNVLQSSFAEYGIDGLFMPRMDYNVSYCNFECTRCSNVCPTGAIIPLNPDQKTMTQIGRVVFLKENCVVPNNNDDCGACAEHCPTHAVFMVPYNQDLYIPEVNPDACIGCGACEHVCPARPFKAIYVEGSENHQLAIKPKGKSNKQKEDVADEFPF